MSYQTFNSFEEAMFMMDEARRDADALVTPWQASLKPGDKFEYHRGGERVVGEVVDPVAMAGDDEEDIADTKECYEQHHMKHYRFCRVFGPQHPNGFLLDIHVSALYPLKV